MRGRGRLHIHRQTRGQLHGAADLVGPAARNHLQVDVAAKPVPPSQKLDRAQHAVHGRGGGSLNRRGKKQAEHSPLAVQIHEGAGQFARAAAPRIAPGPRNVPRSRCKSVRSPMPVAPSAWARAGPRQRSRVDPQAVAASAAAVATARRHRTDRGAPLGKGIERGLHGRGDPEKRHARTILNIRPGTQVQTEFLSDRVLAWKALPLLGRHVRGKDRIALFPE